MTNYERIKKQSLDDLAEWFAVNIYSCVDCMRLRGDLRNNFECKEPVTYSHCIKKWTDWLEKE